MIKMSESNTKRWPQYLAAVSATLSLAVAGSHIGWTSPTLPYLKGPESHLPITSDDASWIASFYLLGNVPGSILGGLVVDFFGRKSSILLAGFPMLIGWLMILYATNPLILYASRILSGVGQGLVYAICPMYIGEIADKEIRGSLGTLTKLMVTFGELYGHAIGPFVSYDWLVYSSIFLIALFFGTFTFMPESPYWLMMKGREEDYRKSLQFLKRYSRKGDMEKDIEEVSRTVIGDMENRATIFDLLKYWKNRRALFVILGLQLILQFSGICAIENYTQEILEDAGSEIPAPIAVIVLSAMQMAAGLVAAFVVDRVGRRPLLLVTTFFAGTTHVVSGIYYFLKLGTNVDLSSWGMVPVVSVIGYEVIISMGLNPLPYLMLGELFATNVKGSAVGLATAISGILAFIVSKLHQVIADGVGMYMVFVWYGLSCFLGVFFIALWVPETKGKSLREIQDELQNSKRKGKKAEEVVKEKYISTIY